MSQLGSFSGRDSPCGPGERQQRAKERCVWGRGGADPEGRREQRDKTWLSLADGNYLHDNATPGNHSRSMDKAEDKGLKTFFGLQKGGGGKGEI